MRPADLRRTAPAGPWWRIDKGSALGRGRLVPTHERADEANTQPSTEPGRKYAEWASLAISTSILVGLLALIVATSASGEERRATIAVNPLTDSLWSSQGLHYLPVEIVNLGTDAATDLRILLSHSDNSAPSEVRLDVLAGGASAEAVVTFSTPPEAGQIRVQTVTYVKP